MAQKSPSLWKIAWSVDVLSPELHLEAHAASLLMALCRTLPCRIEPVYVIRPGHAASLVTQLEEIEALARAAERRLAEVVGADLFSEVKPYRILTASGPALLSAVEALMQHLTETEADLVVLATHARRGIARALFGSFSENVIARSPVPAVVANPKTTPFERLDQILFPTDFSEESKIVFGEAVKLAHAASARILLVHQLISVDPVLAASVVAPQTAVDLFLENERQKTELAKEWIQEGKASGVHVDFDLIGAEHHFLHALEELAARFPGRTAMMMASRSGPVASLVLGGLAHEVLVESSCPVWVFHPENGRGKTTNAPLTNEGLSERAS